MTVHQPILVGPILDTLNEAWAALQKFQRDRNSEPLPSRLWIVDCTLGGGGHTSHFLKWAQEHATSSTKVNVLSIDQDQIAIDRAKVRFAAEIQEGVLELASGRMSEVLEERQEPVLMLLADLGFSSDQIEDPARGLSFMKSGPLDMRLDPTRGSPLSHWLSVWTERELEEILRDYGEERYSARIAHHLVQLRNQKSLPRSTTELAQRIQSWMPRSEADSRIHPATRCFQAFRIAVNQELEELDRLLHLLPRLLMKGGRAAILSFHSLEDRKVKQAFGRAQKRHVNKYRPESAREDGSQGGLQTENTENNEERGAIVGIRALLKKPIEADEQELSKNPRSRSAKLRIAEREF